MSKPYQGGHKKEGSWPPLEPNTESPNHFYICPDTGEVKPGFPPQVEKNGTAPQIIMDSMPKCYHEGVGRYIESRSEWKNADIAAGTLTFGSIDEPRHHVSRGVSQEHKELKADRRQASETALKAYKDNPEEVSAKVAKQAEEQRAAAEKDGLKTLIDEAT